MRILQLLFVALATVALFSCNNAPEGDKVEAGEAGKEAQASLEAKTFNTDLSASVVNWVGTKPAGEHIGTLNLKSGQLSVKDGQIEAGEFVIDMTSMACTDEGMDDDTKAKLVGHLSSGDFFEVEKYPTAKFAITAVAPVDSMANITHAVTGNLTMKDSTHSITFNANITANENGVTAEAPQFVLDRTKWGIVYNSTSVAGVLKEKSINDNIGLSLKLVAK